jgi:release factor glutamine methyltransferase
MTIKTALAQGVKLLEDNDVPSPRLTAEVLLCHALQREKSYFYAHPEAELPELAWIHYGRYLHERLKGKPTQYITHRQEFYGRMFRVTPDVLIPRPETEHVVEATLEFHAARVLDIGCGSGAIAISIQCESNASVWASDISPNAIRVACENAERLGARVQFAVADLGSCFAPGFFDLIVSNPPYISTRDAAGMQREVRDWEPHLALFAGETGNEMYSRIVECSERLLVPGGHLVLELGYRSAQAVKAMLGAKWGNLELLPDLAGIDRVLVARLVASQ